MQKPPSLTVVVGVLLLELGACEKLKYGGHNVDSGEQNYLSTGGRIRSNLHGPLSIYSSSTTWYYLANLLSVALPRIRLLML